MNKAFGFNKKQYGVSNYLNDPEGSRLEDLIFTSELSENLHILPGGTVPPNPTELVARVALEHLIEKLKTQYDYILLDTAPIGMVADTAIIGRVADMCIYVCRSGYTPKAAFGYINVLQNQKKFNKLKNGVL